MPLFEKNSLKRELGSMRTTLLFKGFKVRSLFRAIGFQHQINELIVGYELIRKPFIELRDEMGEKIRVGELENVYFSLSIEIYNHPTTP